MGQRRYEAIIVTIVLNSFIIVTIIVTIIPYCHYYCHYCSYMFLMYIYFWVHHMCEQYIQN